MSLTKEDLAAIGNLIDEKIAPVKEDVVSLRKLFTTVINIQVGILDKIELLDGQIRLIMFHLNLSPESREMKNRIKAV